MRNKNLTFAYSYKCCLISLQGAQEVSIMKMSMKELCFKAREMFSCEKGISLEEKLERFIIVLAFGILQSKPLN